MNKVPQQQAAELRKFLHAFSAPRSSALKNKSKVSTNSMMKL